MSLINKNQTSIGIGIIGIGLLGLCGAKMIMISDPSEADSRLLPIGIASIITVLGVIEVAFGVLNRDKVVASRWFSLPPNFDKVVLLISTCFFYVWTISALGYHAATALVGLLIFILFGERRMLVLVLVTLLVPVLYHLIFFEGLGIFPPQGKYFDLMNYFQRN